MARKGECTLDTSHTGTKTCWTCHGRGDPASLSTRSRQDAVCGSCQGLGYVCKECEGPIQT
ncbi:MAG: hypothetical protein U0516_02405 [Candidatus Saccharibacteria bacterium]